MVSFFVQSGQFLDGRWSDDEPSCFQALSDRSECINYIPVFRGAVQKNVCISGD